MVLQFHMCRRAIESAVISCGSLEILTLYDEHLIMKYRSNRFLGKGANWSITRW